MSLSIRLRNILERKEGLINLLCLNFVSHFGSPKTKKKKACRKTES